MPTSLWSADERLSRQRLNRMAIINRLFDPIYDVQDVAGTLTTTVTPVAVDGDDIVSGETTHYTVPSSGVAVAVVLRIGLCNTTAASDRACAVHLVPSAGSRAAANQVFGDLVQAGNPLSLVGPWLLSPGDTIRSISATASSGDVALTATVLEFAAQPSGLELKLQDGATLGATAAAQYTCPGDVTQAIPFALTLCNTDTVERTVTVYLLPSGQSAAARYMVHREPLAPGASRIVSLSRTLDPGDVISALASAADVVSCRVTVLEVE